jgi:hypothetical protein
MFNPDIAAHTNVPSNQQSTGMGAMSATINNGTFPFIISASSVCAVTMIINRYQESRLQPDQAFPAGGRGPGRHPTG